MSDDCSIGLEGVKEAEWQHQRERKPHSHKRKINHLTWKDNFHKHKSSYWGRKWKKQVNCKDKFGTEESVEFQFWYNLFKEQHDAKVKLKHMDAQKVTQGSAWAAKMNKF